MRWDWPHARSVIEHLQALKDGDIRHLMILLPPQHGKSTVCTVHFPVWWLEQNPSSRVGVASYNDTLAVNFARQSRRIARRNGILEFAPDRNAMDEWELVTGGKFKAVGVGGGITGNPLELGIIDDPIKSKEEADSEVMRDKVWGWYVTEFSTRCPKGQKILVMTPWNHDDLRGRILNSAEAKQWTVVRFPALAEDDDPLGRQPGEPLCPDRMSLEALQIQRGLDTAAFESLYQCNPTPAEGDFFKVTQIKYLDSAPKGMQTVTAWDLAATEGSGDWTVGVTMGIHDGHVVIVDVQRFRCDTSERDRRIRAVADARRNQIGIPRDPSASGKSTVAYMIRHVLAGHWVIENSTTTKKVERAGPYSSQLNAGSVYLVKGDWNADFVEEHRQFPNGKHDDQVDAAADAYLMLMGPQTDGSFGHIPAGRF